LAHSVSKVVSTMAKQVTDIFQSGAEKKYMGMLDQSTNIPNENIVFNFHQYEKISNCLRSTRLLIEQLDLCLSTSGITNGELYHHVRPNSTDTE
jgi:hypothetical protein